MVNVDKFCICDEIESLAEYWLNFRKKCTKRITGKMNVKIGVWNLQSLNKDINNRYLKMEFLRDTLTNNRFDFCFLIDVNDVKSIILNGFTKYTDGRNILFVKDEILEKFTISKNCFFNKDNKLAFVYLTPNSKDVILKRNILYLLKMKYTIIGDINLKSNKFLGNLVHFTGEDSLQTGAISEDYIKTFTVAAPSDHRFVILEKVVFGNFTRSLKLGEISYEISKSFVIGLLCGEKVMAKPNIKIKRYFVGLNDREQSINAMLDDYIKNNTAKIFKRYNYLWKYDRREPFLGKTVPDLVLKTYGAHLRACEQKVYPKLNKINYDFSSFKSECIIKKTKSSAVNFDFVSLRNIPIILMDFLSDPKYQNVDIINNIIKYINDNPGGIISEVFFLQKNPIVKDFNDVRVIIIIPTVVKIFELLIFDKVMDYYSNLIIAFDYQFGGVRDGSTYQAMLKIKMLQKKFKTSGVMLLDMSKGYDTVNLSILENDIKEIDNREIQTLSLLWVKIVAYMDLTINDKIVRRTRGIPMGLSCSPIFFAFYVHCALRDIEKDLISMYLDDVAIVFKYNEVELNVDYVNRLISAFDRYELIINKKKTVYMTNDIKLDSILKSNYKKVDNTKYLGRLVSLNGDGKITADNRFYNLKGFRGNGVPFWATFFTKRIVFISALDAKLRYRLLMWSCDSKILRTAIWRNDWCFFRKSMGFFSYTQLGFCTFNLFRYFLDVIDVIEWRNKAKNNVANSTIFAEIKEKLLTNSIQRVNDAINNMNFEWDWYKYDSYSDFKYTQLFADYLWKQFQEALVNNYFKLKKEKNEVPYEKTKKFLNSRLFKCFGILHNIVFIHYIPKDNRKKSTFRNKDLFLLASIKAIFKMVEVYFNSIKNNNPVTFVFEDIIKVVDLNFPDDIIHWENDKWEAFLQKELRNLWPFIDLLLKIVKLKKEKGKINEQIFEKELFKNDGSATFFVDGSYNNKESGWGFVRMRNSKEEVYHEYGDVPAEYTYLRNVAGELIATKKVLEYALKENIKEIILGFDYIGIQKYACNEWVAKDKFILDYIKFFRQVQEKIKIKLVKVPSHTGLLGNELADKYAKMGADINVAEIKKKFVFSEDQINQFKDLYKFVFKYLTIVETVYLNSNLNDLTLEFLWLNLNVKYYLLSDFSEKQFNVAESEEFCDNCEDKFVDIYF